MEKTEKDNEAIAKITEIGGYWTGKIRERKGNFSRLNDALNGLYSHKNKVVFVIPPRFRDWSNSFSSSYNLSSHTITLRGKLSLITFLHEWGHALYGRDESKAQDYAVRLFKTAYPEKFAKLKGCDEFDKIVYVIDRPAKLR